MCARPRASPRFLLSQWIAQLEPPMAASPEHSVCRCGGVCLHPSPRCAPGLTQQGQAGSGRAERALLPGPEASGFSAQPALNSFGKLSRQVQRRSYYSWAAGGVTSRCPTSYNFIARSWRQEFPMSGPPNQNCACSCLSPHPHSPTVNAAQLSGPWFAWASKSFQKS